MNNNEIKIVFTDLDGTLLDHSTYSYSEAEKALRSLREKGIHLVLCSSKSRDEIKIYRDKLTNNEPFISENGGAIYIPEEYGLKCEFDRTDNGFLVIEIGSEYKILKSAFEKIKRKTGINIKSISEFTVDEIVELTGLSREEACLALKKKNIHCLLLLMVAKKILRILGMKSDCQVSIILKVQGLHTLWVEMIRERQSIS